MSKLSSEEEAVKVGIYARVSTDAQEARGTIGSQLDTLRARVAVLKSWAKGFCNSRPEFGEPRQALVHAIAGDEARIDGADRGADLHPIWLEAGLMQRLVNARPDRRLAPLRPAAQAPPDRISRDRRPVRR